MSPHKTIDRLKELLQNTLDQMPAAQRNPHLASALAKAAADLLGQIRKAEAAAAPEPGPSLTARLLDTLREMGRAQEDRLLAKDVEGFCALDVARRELAACYLHYFGKVLPPRA